MTVSSTTVKSGPYNGNGSTTNFAVNTKYTAKSEVSVIVTSSAGVETTKTLDTHYTLTDPGDSGTAAFITSPTDFRPQTGETVTIITTLAQTQATDLTVGGAFSATVIEGAFDKLTRLVQQIAEKVTRSPKLRQTTTTGEVALPEPSALAFVRWNSGGTDLENGTTGGPGSGDVVGPASSTNNNLAAFDGTSGGVLKDSGISISNVLTEAEAAAGYQPLDADLTAIAALSTASYGRSLLTLANATALAAEVDSFFLTPSEGNAAYQPLDADLTAIAALSTTSFGRSVLTLANAAALATLAGLGTGDSPQFAGLLLPTGAAINWNSGDVTITHSANALAFAGASSGYSFDAAVNITAGNLGLGFANASIEIGNGTANTPFIDFRSSANSVDYDTRLIASGGDATLGGGLLSLTGRFAINPRAASLHRGYVVTQSGAGSSAGNFAFNDIRVDEDHVDGGAGASKIDALQIVHLFGSSSMRGGRHGLEVTAVLNSASHASNPDRNYVGAAFTGLANSADGGGSGTEQGAFFGINAQAAAFSGATFLANISAAEFNTSAQTGSSVRYKSIIQLCGRDDDVVQGSTYDCMLALSNQTTAVKWEDGILIGNMNGQFPIDTSGSILRATAGTVTKGIDLSALTISGNAFASPNFSVTGSGTISMGAQLNTGAGVSTGDVSMELGSSRTGDGNVYIDFHARSATDYECRFLRNGGANGAASFANTGTGDFSFTQEGAGALSFKISNTERFRIDAAGMPIWQPSSATPATLGTNGQITMTLTSNTNLRFSARGSDGTTRVANLTLA